MTHEFSKDVVSNYFPVGIFGLEICFLEKSTGNLDKVYKIKQADIIRRKMIFWMHKKISNETLK